jgi:hypothetical protein
LTQFTLLNVDTTLRDRGHAMPNLEHLRPNRLRQEAEQRDVMLTALGLIAVASGLLIHPAAALAIILPIPFLWAKRQRLLAGAVGEDRALGFSHDPPGSLLSLPDDYVIFTQLRIRHGERERELDQVVIGPDAIFVIEVKNLGGEIAGSETDARWIQRRRDSSGNVILEREFRSPVLQVGYQVQALRRVLASKGIHAWVQGIVVMVNPRCRLAVRSLRTPVLTLESLAPYIEHFRAPRRPAGLHLAEAEIERLRSLCDTTHPFNWMMRSLRLLRHSLRRSIGGPRHISYFMTDFVDNRIGSFMKEDAEQSPSANDAPRPEPIPDGPNSSIVLNWPREPARPAALVPCGPAIRGKPSHAQGSAQAPIRLSQPNKEETTDGP